MNEAKATVAISSDFLSAFAALPRSVQGKVTDFLNKFRNNPKSPGINYEKIASGADKKICSVRIDDTYRGIVVRQEETGTYLLLWVDHHDKAYAWAQKKRCEVNPRTGAIQVFDIQLAEHVPEQTSKGLFSDCPERDLLRLGVPETQIAFVKSLPSADALHTYASSLPTDAYEALSWLAEGFPMEEVVELMEAQAAADAEDLSRALSSPETLKSFVVVEGEDELRRIMAEPLEKWRVFLHPTQRKIVHKTYSGPARVLGGAGTGKTVVAMHRAKELAAKAAKDDRILVTTYTANLAGDIRENLKKICSTEELRKIEVIHLDAWVSSFLREQGYTASLVYDDDVRKLWETAMVQSGTNSEFTADFYEDEWNRIVIAQEVTSLQDYVKANRNGRGTRLDRRKRIQIWSVFEAYQKLMKEQSVRDINTAMYDSRILLQKKNCRVGYKHIIVDEAQDFSENAFRLLRALAGEEHENDIFIVGDSHQRIYKNRAVLSRCGINIRGRSSVLKINYRTTEEIRKYAFAVLNGISFDDLDEDTDPGDQCQSLTHGTAPVCKTFRTSEEEMDFISEEIRKLNDSGVPADNICLIGRTHKIVASYIDQMRQRGMEMLEIRQNTTDNHAYRGLRAATMHRVKGLEFSYIFIVSANNRIIPLATAINRTDTVSERESLTAEKCLLYVALTRARQGAYITGYGKPSEFIVNNMNMEN